MRAAERAVALALPICAALLLLIALQPLGYRLPTFFTGVVALFGVPLVLRAARLVWMSRRRTTELTEHVEEQRELSATLEQCVSDRTAELAEAERVLRRMWTLGQHVTSELQPDRVLSSFVEAVVDIAQADGGALALLAEGDRVRIAAATGVGADSAGLLLPLASSAMGRVVSSGVTWQNEDVTRQLTTVYGPVWRPSNDGRVCGVAVVPVRRRGAVVGAFELVSRTPRRFGEQELERVRAMTDILSVALANAELVEGLRQAEWRFRTLFRAAPDPVLTVTADGRVTEANECVRDVTGVELESAIGRPLADFVEPEDREALEGALAQAMAGKPARLEVRTMRVARDRPPVDGVAAVELRVVDIAARRVPAVEPPLVLLVGRDTTAEREMRARLLESERLAAVGELVAGVAHEVNNPLSSISAYSQLLLRDGALDDAQRESVEVIRSETLRASQVVKDLLSFSRRSTPQREAMFLNQVVERTLRLRNYQLSASGIGVELALAPDLPSVLGDARQLQQVVLNLITNSIQAMAPVPGSTMRGGLLRVSTRVTDAGVLLEVADTGRGIPAAARPRVFEPFFTTKKEGEGTGLGLSVSYGIVAAHGGSIALANSSSAGTTFVVTLPAALAEPEPEVPTRAPADVPRRGGRSALVGTRVLFVDDEQSLRSGMEAFARMRGFAVATAEDGAAALVAVQERSFDAVVCDLRMPGMDGLAFHRELARERPGLAQRTVFITGDVVSAPARHLAGTRQPTIAKPFTFERLEETLAAVMRGSVVGAASA